jgi:hypothetical protein
VKGENSIKVYLAIITEEAEAWLLLLMEELSLHGA